MDRIKRIEEDLRDCSVDNRSCVACRSILSILKILLILSNSWPGQRHWSGGLPPFSSSRVAPAAAPCRSALHLKISISFGRFPEGQGMQAAGGRCRDHLPGQDATSNPRFGSAPESGWHVPEPPAMGVVFGADAGPRPSQSLRACHPRLPYDV